MNNISDDYSLITKIWGPSMWISMHSIAFCYPHHPTEIDKQNYKQFYTLLGDVLPCSFCRESYRNFIKTGSTKLDDNALENRESLTKWLYVVHETVNKKLCVDYDVSYDDVVKRYESYRASCHSDDQSVPNNLNSNCDASTIQKIRSFKMANHKECPVIPTKIAKHFINYAHIRGLKEEDLFYVNNSDSICGNKKKNIDYWTKRDNECCQILNEMREQGILSIEKDGQWQDLPTIHELKLIMRFSSNLSREKLVDLIQKLPRSNCNYQKIYKLVK